MAYAGRNVTLLLLVSVILLALAPDLPAQLPSPLSRFGNLLCLAPIIRNIDRDSPKNIGEALLLPPYDAPEDTLEIGTTSFPITTRRPEAQKAFNRGIALLHLFWTVEAERSFRQVAALDPGNPMPYWGLAIANERFPGRASVYINYANHLAGKNPGITPIEHAWIKAYHHYFSPGPGDPESGSAASRRQRNRQLEDMAYAYPDSFETRAFLLREIILDDYRAGIPISSKFTTDALARQLAKQKADHPSRHYRFWLWSRERPQRVIEDALSSPLVSPFAPASWRFSANALVAANRFHDSLRSRENALRLAHRRMLVRLSMPDDNQDYVADAAARIDTMIACGQVKAAANAARELIRLPRSAYLNKSRVRSEAAGNGAYRVGRRLLAQTLIRSEQWQVLLRECTIKEGCLRATTQWVERTHNLYWHAIADLNLGNHAQAGEITQQLESLFREFLRNGTGINAEKEITHALKSLRSYSAFFTGTRSRAPKDNLLHIGNFHLARLARAKGNLKLALDLARQDLQARPGKPDATANFCSIAFTGNVDNARNEALLAFNTLFRRNASLADRDCNLFHKDLQPVIKHLKLRGNWTLPPPVARKIPGFPLPENLGSSSWAPATAPAWSLTTANATTMSLEKFRGKPVLLIFFVGIGCPYCVEQLKVFAPHEKSYADAGIEILTISSDHEELLKERLAAIPAKADKIPEFPFLLLSDPSLQTFKNYRCFDEFDNKAMHGVFLISPKGELLWSNVSHEPFLYPKFLLEESSRLLGIWNSPAD